MGTSRPGTCSRPPETLPLHSKRSVSRSFRSSRSVSPSDNSLPIYKGRTVSNQNEEDKRRTTRTRKTHRMPNDLPRFPIKQLPKDFPIEQLTPFKRSKYDFDPSESRSNSIFRFRYKLSSKHVLEHRWYCKLDYCPFHHQY